VDEGNHVGLEERPFWYMGALTVYHMGQNCTRMDLHDPAAVEPAKAKVSTIADRLRSQGGGLISIYYHPCEWVHKQFWDGVNFSRGANPPRAEWKQPPQRAAEDTDAAFARFGQYVDHIRHLDGVRFVTASELPLLYPDPVRHPGATEKELDQLAARLVAAEKRSLDFRIIDDRAFSLADQFELLAAAVGMLAKNEVPQFPLAAKGLLGPEAAPPTSKKMHVAWPAFRDASCDVLEFVQIRHSVPARVFIGADAVSPGDFLVALAGVWLHQRQKGSLPLAEGVELGAGLEFPAASRVAEDTPGLFGGWVIHKEGFRAPQLLELARLQTWTIKPALRKK